MIRAIGRILLLAVAVGCRVDRPHSGSDSQAAPQRDARWIPQANASLDSTQFRPGFGLPHLGSWTSVKTFEAERFTIAYPASAKAELRHGDEPGMRMLLISELPACRWPCFVSVQTWRDSTNVGLADYVHRHTHPDTSGGHADAADYAARLIDSIPLGGSPAMFVEEFCGDCTKFAIYSVSDDWMAHIEYSIDDRDGDNPELQHRLETVLRSFRWRSR